jgi:hypothetical protein
MNSSLYSDRFGVAEKVSDPDGAKHPKGRSGHRGQTPFPKTQDLASQGIKEDSLIFAFAFDFKRVSDWISIKS